MTELIDQIADRLCSAIAQYGSVGVAFSGGVDSSVVAKAASTALGDSAVAIIGVGPALSAFELDTARSVAQAIGIRVVEVEPDELSSTGYVANAGDRCYYCKTQLYESCEQALSRLGIETILNGTNADDLGDYRPGLRAASEYRVRSPLVDLAINKEGVRKLARHWGLPVWNKPASPCLASRIAPHVSVTAERLAMIEQAEAVIRETVSLDDFRVRIEADELARIEIPAERLVDLTPRLACPEVLETLKALGFRRVTIDLEGFRSGNLNELIQLDVADSAGQKARNETHAKLR